jgi:Zn-dependent protease with chaperone function
VRPPAQWFVRDDPTVNGGVLGNSLCVNRGAFDSPYLEALLAHELGHLNSMDGRISLAIWRLAVLPGHFSQRPTGGLLAHVRWLALMLADGTLAMFLTRGL